MGDVEERSGSENGDIAQRRQRASKDCRRDEHCGDPAEIRVIGVLSGLLGERAFQVRREERESDKNGERERDDEGVLESAFGVERPKERASSDHRSNLPREGPVFCDRRAFAKQPDGHAREIRDRRRGAESDDRVLISIGNGFVHAQKRETGGESQGERRYGKSSNGFGRRLLEILQRSRRKRISHGSCVKVRTRARPNLSIMSDFEKTPERPFSGGSGVFHIGLIGRSMRSKAFS